MIDIRFEFPIDQEHKEWLIGCHRKQGRQWVSTAFVEGKMRMKFERIRLREQIAPAKKRKRQPKPKASATGKIRYAGYDRSAHLLGESGDRRDW